MQLRRVAESSTWTATPPRRNLSAAVPQMLRDLQRQVGNGAIAGEVATLRRQRCECGGACQHPTSAVGLMLQRQAGAEFDCPRRDSGEARTSRTSGFLPIDTHLTGNVLVVQDFGVSSALVPVGVAAEEAWQRAMSYIAGDPAMALSIEGFADCRGDAQPNLRLRQRRADGVRSLFPAAVRGRATFSYSVNPYSYLSTNATTSDRARNRAVKVSFAAVRGGPTVPLTGARDMDEYLHLVRQAESALGLTTTRDAPMFLSALRQIYYGSGASARSRNAVWDDVVTSQPWSPGTNPDAALGPQLSGALRATQTVEGMDIGHVLTGLDAMRAPGEVEATVGIFGIATGVDREAWASWAGDVGSAAAEYVISGVARTRAGRAPADFFRQYASPADLQADIDAYAIRNSHNLRSGTDPRNRALRLNAPLSEVLLRYYRLEGRTEGASRASAKVDFVKTFGGVYRAGRLTNRANVVNSLHEQATGFSNLFYMKQGVMAYGDPALAAAGQVEPATRTMTELFVDWLLIP